MCYVFDSVERKKLDKKDLTAIMNGNTLRDEMNTTLNLNRPYPTLKAWRQAHGYSQRQAAAILNISQGYYSRLETRTQPARGRLAARIMSQTGVPIEVLVGAA